MRAHVICASIAIVGIVSCGAPIASVRSAIGIRVTSVTIEGVEGAPVRIEDTERLRTLVALLDRERLSELAMEQPTTSCRAVGDVTLTLRTTSRSRIACVHVDDETFSRLVRCPFFATARSKGLLTTVPPACVGVAPLEEPCVIHELP